MPAFELTGRDGDIAGLPQMMLTKGLWGANCGICIIQRSCDGCGARSPGGRNAHRLVSRRHFANSRQRLKGLERVAGIEPASQAWKASALPLSYTRLRQ